MTNTSNKKKINDYLVKNFDRAIDEGWIEIYYQPVVRTSNGRICEEEALARWDDPEIGIINAVDFVPALEEAGIIEKLDLYVLSHAIDKMKQYIDRKLHVVTTSINFSQVDFQKGDISAEIDKIVSDANIAKDRIAIEVSESSVSVNRDNTLAQLQSLQQLGYKIELDDYGCCDISILFYPQAHFDILKINRTFVKLAMKYKNARVILKELLRTAGNLGIETIVKGVESKKQYELLSELGCAKMQGYYFSKPCSLLQIFEKYRTGKQIGFENPDESFYYGAIDKVNLHDISFLKEKSGLVSNMYDSFPMAIIEVDDDGFSVLKENSSCMKFIHDNFPQYSLKQYISFENRGNFAGSYIISSIRNASKTDELIIIDERAYNGKTTNVMLQRIAMNPVTGVSAVLFAVISVQDKSDANDALTYNYIARAISEDYIAMIMVDLETDEYTTYNSNGINRDVTLDTHGKNFFKDAHDNKEGLIYEEDLEMFNELCTKENIIKSIEENGVFSITYRANDNRGVHYVNFKAVGVMGDNKRIIIGVNDIDNQIKKQQLFTKIQEESVIYSRISALVGNLFAVYSVDITDDSYAVYKTPEGIGFIGTKDKGFDFFNETRKIIKSIIHKDDLEEFQKKIRKDNILSTIAKDGVFEHTYRLIIYDQPTYVLFKAVISKENEDSNLIVGIINIDAMVRKDEKYAENLSAAENMALRDELTGIKNKHAYSLAQNEIETILKEGKKVRYAIIVLDLNGLKNINDTFGHQKGDEFIKEGCKLICDTFSHSPVYRIGGDEFSVIVQGKDYDRIDTCLSMIEQKNNSNRINGGVTVAFGMAKNSEAKTFSKVFELADSRMYIKKKRMKTQT